MNTRTATVVFGCLSMWGWLACGDPDAKDNVDASQSAGNVGDGAGSAGSGNAGASGGAGGSISSGSGGGGAVAGGSGGTAGNTANGGTGGRGGTVGGAGSGGAMDAGVLDVATALADAGRPNDGLPASAAWDTFGKAFMEKYCVSCHNDDKTGVAARDYHMLAVVMRERAEIACGTAKSMAVWTDLGCKGFPPARQFPVGNGPKPTDDERDRLVAWIRSGTP